MTMQAPAQRHWSQNYSNEVLQQMLKENPAYGDMFPQETWDTFSHDWIAQNPQYAQKLSPQQQQVFYQNNPHLNPGVATPVSAPIAAQSPVPGVAQAGVATPVNATIGAQPGSSRASIGLVGPPRALGGTPGSPAQGDRTGFLERGGPSGVTLNEPQYGTNTPLAPRVAAPITGAQMPLYRSSGGVPIFSSQAIARMTPGDREILGTTVNRAGGNATDYFDQQRKMFRAPTGGGARYSGTRRY